MGSVKVDVPTHCVHRLLYPRSLVLVSCVDGEGKANIITLAWSMPTSFNPPKAAVSVGLGRYTHRILEETREFVVNIPTMRLLRQVLFCGSVSGRRRDKFKEAGLTPQPARRVRAPIVGECVAHLECKLSQALTTGDHTIFVGDVLEAYADQGVFREKYLLENAEIILQVGEGDFQSLKPQPGRAWSPKT
ncbi:flavin reductase family protein [Candidatus Hecatella orcuttiae]|jgi:flavin reductase (DIM6/NTAB) family NADH-FMN oxidoreductase RutF|uniref:flavin reductase family protein n=1 Tax=Candidatus Hecatella orcuttiae TaxID=1935119 RepID=UPI002867D9A5|nr:flavin reductase family protein [Candidatus Hecatella orcuttiae]